MELRGWVKLSVVSGTGDERFARAMRLSPLDSLAVRMRSGTAQAMPLAAMTSRHRGGMALQDDRTFNCNYARLPQSHAMAGRPEQAHEAIRGFCGTQSALRYFQSQDLVVHRVRDLSL